MLCFLFVFFFLIEKWGSGGVEKHSQAVVPILCALVALFALCVLVRDLNFISMWSVLPLEGL